MADHLVTKFWGLCAALTVALLTLALIAPAGAEASGPGLARSASLLDVVPAPAQAAVAAALAQVPSPPAGPAAPSPLPRGGPDARTSPAGRAPTGCRTPWSMSRRWPSRSQPTPQPDTANSRRQRFPCRQSRYARRANGRIRPLQPGPTRPSVGRRAHIASRVRRGAGPGRGAFEARRGRRRRGRAHSPPSERGGRLCRPPTPSSFTPTTPRAVRGAVTRRAQAFGWSLVTSLRLHLPAVSTVTTTAARRLRSRPPCRRVVRRAAPPGAGGGAAGATAAALLALVGVCMLRALLPGLLGLGLAPARSALLVLRLERPG